MNKEKFWNPVLVISLIVVLVVVGLGALRGVSVTINHSRLTLIICRMA